MKCYEFFYEILVHQIKKSNWLSDSDSLEIDFFSFKFDKRETRKMGSVNSVFLE